MSAIHLSVILYYKPFGKVLDFCKYLLSSLLQLVILVCGVGSVYANENIDGTDDVVGNAADGLDDTPIECTYVIQSQPDRVSVDSTTIVSCEEQQIVSSFP
eukprot:PhF_6_TR13701/c4_g3_i12/m.22113